MPRLYVAVFEALSPLLIRKRGSPRGFEGIANYIPGSTLAPAIARVAGLSGGYELITRGFSVSDSYPIRIDNKPYIAIPAPPGSFRVKSIGRDTGAKALVCGPTRSQGSQAARSIAEDYWASRIGFPPIGLVKEVKVSTPIVILGNEPLFEKEGQKCFRAEEIKVEPEHSYDSVAINPARGSAEPEMLFTYYALERGTVFWATISLPDSARLPGQALANIGGGQSRGYGRIRLCFEEIPTEVLESLRKIYQGVVQRGNDPLIYLWSPLPAKPPSIPSWCITGWSTVLDQPKASIPAHPPGTIMQLSMLHGIALENPLAARFQGLVPPLGHAEPLASSPVPPSFPYLQQIVENIMGRCLGR